MSGKDKSLRQVFQLAQEVMAQEEGGITAEDINVFRRRPHGPQPHPMLVRSMRLPEPYTDEPYRLKDLRVTGDGTLCFLWDLPGSSEHGLRVQLGERSWYLKYEESAVLDGGRIIGFNKEQEPIVEMSWSPDHEIGCSCSMIYIGDRAVKHTLTQATTRVHEAWSMGGDGRLWCMRKERYNDRPHHQPVGYNAVTGERETNGKIIPCAEGRVRQMALSYNFQYAFITEGVSGGKTSHTVTLVNGQPKQWFVKGSARLALLERTIWLIEQERDRLTNISSTNTQFAEQMCGYLRGLTFDIPPRAFIMQLPHKQEGWAVGGKPQPGFDRVTELFLIDKTWHYWALSQNHLFLMELRPNR